MTEDLDGLKLIQYNVGGAVDISAPLNGAGRQLLSRIYSEDVDASTLTVDEWARRKNADFRTSIVPAGLLVIDFLMSRTYPGIRVFKNVTPIEYIGRYMADDWKKFWFLWSLKMVAAGFIFSRVFPWAVVGTSRFTQLTEREVRQTDYGPGF